VRCGGVRGFFAVSTIKMELCGVERVFDGVTA